MQRRFNRYNLTRELAKKHSHTTYLASPSNPQRGHGEPEHQVVLTVFSASFFHFPHERENLLQKAQRIRELQHSHLVPILDMGIEKEQLFVVREYLPNGSLRSRLRQITPDRLELEEALTLVLQVGEALDYAHEQNIIHGNIKPENILFGANGQIFLTDFHLVARNDAIIRDQIEEEHPFCYLAPEQLVGTCDAQSDQYALGCLVYELITGQVPFGAQSLSSMMGYPSNALPASLFASVPDLPPSLEAAVLKTLAKDPAERFFDFSLFLEVVRSVVSPPPAFPLARSTHSHKNRTISHPIQSPKAEDISFSIHKRPAKHVVPQTPEPSKASLSAEGNIAEPAIASSIPNASMLRQMASMSTPQLLELAAEVELFTSLAPTSTYFPSKTANDRVNHPLQVDKKDTSSTTMFKAMSHLDILIPELGVDIPLTQGEIDSSLFSKSFAEAQETGGSLLPKLFFEEVRDVSLPRASINSIYGQDDFRANKIAQLPITTIDVFRPRRVGLSSRKRVLGLGLLLSMMVALLTYMFWPFEMYKPDTSLQPAQRMSHGVVLQPPTQASITPTVQLSAQASITPTAQPSALVTSNSIAQSSSQITTNGPTFSPSQGLVPTTNMATIFYGWTDNTPEGTAIAYPTIHKSAGGVGTYSDPITFAGSKAALSPGTVVYVPYLKKYFVMEDDCSPCDSAWRNNHSYIINMWIGGDANSNKSAQQSCENSLSRSSVGVEVRPPSDQVVDMTPLFTDSRGCIKL